MNTDTVKSDHKAPIWGLIFASALAGGASAFSMAPYFLWPLLIVSLAILFMIQHKIEKNWQCFISGWLFGFFYFSFSLSWIGNALLVEGNEYAWAWPLAVTGLPALLAFFPAIACYLAKRIYSGTLLRFYMALSALLTLAELVRGYIFTGFPWNLYGYTWGNNLEMLQFIHFGNIYWLTSLTLFWGLGLGYAFLLKKQGILPLLVIILSVGAIYLYGHLRLQNIPVDESSDITIKLVQPNIDQAEKWQREKMPVHYSRLLQLSIPDGDETETTLIVWPETATNYMFMNDDYALSQLRDVLQSYSGQAYLIAGVFLRDEAGLPSNSLLVFDKNANIIHRYDKSHLVPFGEYIPYKEWIPLETVSGFSGFQRGEGRTNIQLTNNFSFSPLICYEILFPSQVILQGSTPNAIINVTNDGWYGISAGPHQHYLMAKIRAIEESTPVIRVANTGFSGVFDQFGHEKMHMNLFESGNATLKSFNFPSRHVLKQYHDSFFMISMLLFLLILSIKLEKDNILSDKK